LRLRRPDGRPSGLPGGFAAAVVLLIWLVWNMSRG
jgi:hypothetical protein